MLYQCEFCTKMGSRSFVCNNIMQNVFIFNPKLLCNYIYISVIAIYVWNWIYEHKTHNLYLRCTIISIWPYDIEYFFLEEVFNELLYALYTYHYAALFYALSNYFPGRLIHVVYLLFKHMYQMLWLYVKMAAFDFTKTFNHGNMSLLWIYSTAKNLKYQ